MSKTQVELKINIPMTPEPEVAFGAVLKKTQIKNGLEALADQTPELHAYCITLYWTILNLFGAYRYLNTGVTTSNSNSETNIKESLMVAGAKKLASYGAEMAKGAPFLEGILGLLDSVIDDIYSAVKDNRLQNKINSITKIIQTKLGTEDDISISIAKMALAVTAASQVEIQLDTKSEVVGKLAITKSWFEDKIAALRSKVLPLVGLNDTSSKAVYMALKDATLLTAYLCLNCDTLLASNEPLDEQMAAITQQGKLNNLEAYAVANVTNQMIHGADYKNTKEEASSGLTTELSTLLISGDALSTFGDEE